MGLDMYLYRKNYVQNWSHTAPQERHEITIKKGDKVREDIKPERIAYIVEQIGVWRKFNALHNWIIEECAEGEDNCQEIYLSSDKMHELLYTLKNAIKVLNKAKKKKTTIKTGWSSEGDTFADIDVYDCEEELDQILPTQSGFFFGSVLYDEYYKENIKETIEIIENELNNNMEADYYYQASW